MNHFHILVDQVEVGDPHLVVVAVQVVGRSLPPRFEGAKVDYEPKIDKP